MKGNLLDYLKKDEEAEPEAKDPLEGMDKAELLAMKYEMSGDPEKRAKALVALVQCIAGSKTEPETEE